MSEAKELAPLRRAEITVTATLLTALHIGTGHHRIDRRPGKDGDGDETETTEVAVLARGADDVVFIPGSTLKGAMRAFMGEEKASAFFGKAHELNKANRAASVIVYDAYFVSDPGEEKKAGPGEIGPKNSDFALSRTKIETGRGISDPNKLFTKDHMVPGSEFKIRLRLEERGADFDKRLEELLALLGHLSNRAAAPLGANTASGFGRFKLAAEAGVKKWAYGDDLIFRPGNAETRELECIPEKLPFLTLKLTTQSPYLSRAPEPPGGQKKDDKERKAESNIVALRHEGRPFITGDAISAKLRAKMEWLARLNRAAESYADGAFGTTERAAAFDIDIREVDRKEAKSITSVRIDRFSGGVIDNALMKFDTDHGVEFIVEIYVNSRADDEMKKALKEAAEAMESDGAELGMGSAGGFGWFDVKLTQHEGGEDHG